MNGPIVNMNKPMTRAEFKNLDDSAKRSYIIYLCANYGARRADIGKMLGYSANGFWSLSKQLFGSPSKEPYVNKSKHPSELWLNFINPPANDEVEEHNDEVEERIEKCDGTPPETIEKCDTTPAIKGDNLTLESYRVRYTGNIVLACADVLKMLRHDVDYVINIEVYPANDTPTCMSF